ncbi:hypothetical protein SBY92_001574 [Candida maltosa Xu316]
MSIFKPRSVVSSSSSASTSTPTVTVDELTKNEHYCVSRFPALPSVVKSSSFNNAYSDSESNYSLVINDDSIYVWCYKSLDSNPLAIEFPIEKSIFKLPMALLTRPSSGTGQDPGLVILDSVNGLVKFYESVQHAPTLGLINDKSLELSIPLKKDEYITLAENVEPAGIVIATSLHRCFVITLRDFKSKPQLGSETHEIVAIRSGKITNHGTIQEIIVLDSTGNFHLYSYNLFSANALPYVDKKKSFSQPIYIDFDAFPGTTKNVDYLDIWQTDDIYVVLCQVERSLCLVTLKIDKSGVLPFGSHKLKTADGSTSKPKLYLPKPGKTAFVVLDNSIILTDLNTSYIESKNLSSYYKPRWEDVVRFKSSVEIIGTGYENNSPSSNPALILITKNFGVIRVEKFPESQTNEVIEPLEIVKSHIEQAIFYSDVNEIDFDLSQRFDKETIQKAIELIIEEVLNSSSPYLPKSLPSINDLTSLKVKLYKTLIEYVERNFDKSIIPQIVENLEKSDVAFQMWKIIDNNEPLKTILAKQVPDLRDFFTHGLKNINQVLTTFIETLMEQNLPVVPLIVNTLYDGVYLNDIKYIHQTFKSWIFETNLIVRVEEVFTRDFVDNEGDSTIALKLVEILYYFVNSAIGYMKVADEDQLDDYQKWYNNRKSSWIGVLLKSDLDTEAVQIAEKYQDFSSLARILDVERETKSIDELNYGKYFEVFGYPFASAVYEYYLTNDKIQVLLLDFTNYKHYLLRFFQENPNKTAKVSWIRFLLDSEFGQASNSLVKAAEQQDSLENQSIKYSLAKLSAIASGNEDHLNDINNELLIIKYQNSVRQGISEIGRIEAIKEASFVKNYVNTKIDKKYVQPIVDEYFEQFSKNLQLSNGEVINLLTTVLPSLVNKYGFAYAYKIGQSIQHQGISDYYAAVVLVRLLTIGDESLYNSKDSDQVSKKKVTESGLYKTLKLNTGAIPKLEQLLANPYINNEYEDNISIKDFNESLVSQLIKQLDNDKFKSWVESIKEQAKL